MINKEFIKRKLLLIQQDLERLQEFAGCSVDEVAKDPVKHAATERYLERIIGRAIDINQEKGSVSLPVLRYRETFLALSELGVYPKEFAEKIAPCAGLRNALVHEYDDIDPQMFEKSIGDAVREFAAYDDYVLAFLETQ
jgi:uncharacterized protein YutE (UPF0331/DUF86 family)